MALMSTHQCVLQRIPLQRFENTFAPPLPHPEVGVVMASEEAPNQIEKKEKEQGGFCKPFLHVRVKNSFHLKLGCKGELLEVCQKTVQVADSPSQWRSLATLVPSMADVTPWPQRLSMAHTASTGQNSSWTMPKFLNSWLHSRF